MLQTLTSSWAGKSSPYQYKGTTSHLPISSSPHAHAGIQTRLLCCTPSDTDTSGWLRPKGALSDNWRCPFKCHTSYHSIFQVIIGLLGLLTFRIVVCSTFFIVDGFWNIISNIYEFIGQKIDGISIFSCESCLICAETDLISLH